MRNCKSKRSSAKFRNRRSTLLPVEKLAEELVKLTSCEKILIHLGYDYKDFEFISKTTDKINFRQISTGRILDLHI